MRKGVVAQGSEIRVGRESVRSGAEITDKRIGAASFDALVKRGSIIEDGPKAAKRKDHESVESDSQ